MAVIKRAIGTVGAMWNDNDPRQFTSSLAQMLIYSQSQLCRKHEYIHFIWPKASYHELARTELVDNAVGDWLLQLDCDHMFAPDLLERLLLYKKKHKARVISGVYCYKSPPYGPVANLWSDDGKVLPLGAWDPKLDVLQIGPVGGGVLLSDTSVFDQIKSELKQQPFHIIQGFSEDYSFCKRCKDLKIPVYLALRVESHHLGPRFAIHIDDYTKMFTQAFPTKKDSVTPSSAQSGGNPEVATGV